MLVSVQGHIYAHCTFTKWISVAIGAEEILTLDRQWQITRELSFGSGKFLSALPNNREELCYLYVD